MLTTANFYNKFSFIYPLISTALARQQRLLITHVNGFPPGKLLEIGVGNGAQLKNYDGMEITGIDLSEAMLKKAGKNSSGNITFIRMNAQNLEFPDNSFNYIIISHTLAVAENPEQILQEAYRVLKPAGRLFILNHFTPGNPLKILDCVFQPFAKLLKFKSVFYKKDLKTLNQFRSEATIPAGFAGYFQLLICSKP